MSAATALRQDHRVVRIDRKQQILDAAGALVAVRGLDGVTVADIANEVGVTAPALYRHFHSKDAIHRALTEQVLDRLTAILGRARSSEAPIDELVGTFTAEILDHPSAIAAYLRERRRLTGTDDARLRRREAEFVGGFCDVLASSLSGGGHDAADVRRRVDAAVGILRACAERPPRLARPHADAFLSDALLALLLSPVADVEAPPARTRTDAPGTWRPDPTPRERILTAALTLFRDHGVDGTSVSLIGETAGVGPSNVGRYYPSKSEILTDLYDRVGARVEVSVEDAVRRAHDPRDAIHRLATSYTEIAFAAADLIVVVTENRGALPMGERDRLRRRDRRIMDVWRAALGAARPDLRPTEVATLAALALPAINAFPRQSPDALPHPSVVTPLVHAFLLGARP